MNDLERAMKCAEALKANNFKGADDLIDLIECFKAIKQKSSELNNKENSNEEN